MKHVTGILALLALAFIAYAQGITKSIGFESTTVTLPASTAASVTATCNPNVEMCPSCDRKNITDPIGTTFEILCDYVMISQDQEKLMGPPSLQSCMETCDEVKECGSINFFPDGSCALALGDQDGLINMSGYVNLFPVATKTFSTSATPTSTYSEVAASAFLTTTAGTSGSAKPTASSPPGCDLLSDDPCPGCDHQYIIDVNGTTYHVLCDNDLYLEGTYSVQHHLTPLGCLAQCDSFDWCQGTIYYPGGNCQLAQGDNVFPQVNAGYAAFLPVALRAASKPTATQISAFPTGGLGTMKNWNSTATIAGSANGTNSTATALETVTAAAATASPSAATASPTATAAATTIPSAMTTIRLTSTLASTSFRTVTVFVTDGLTNSSLTDSPTPTGSSSSCGLSDFTCPACNGTIVTNVVDQQYQGICDMPVSCEMDVPKESDHLTLDLCLQACDRSGSGVAALWTPGTNSSCTVCQDAMYRDLSGNTPPYIVFLPYHGPAVARSSTAVATISSTSLADSTSSGASNSITTAASLSYNPGGPIINSTSTLSSTSSTTSSVSGFDAQISGISCPLYDADVVRDPSDGGYIEICCDSGFSAARARTTTARNFQACAALCTVACDGIQFSSTSCGLYTSILAVSSLSGWTAGASISFPTITSIEPTSSASKRHVAITSTITWYDGDDDGASDETSSIDWAALEADTVLTTFDLYTNTVLTATNLYTTTVPATSTSSA